MAWEQLCPIYMPGLLQHKVDAAATPISSAPSTDNPEATTIWLPSQIPCEKRVSVCQKELDVIEEKLRSAQCQDALEGVRHILKIKTRMIAFKNRNIRGQREGTRSRAVIDRVHERARNMAQKYRAARAAKMKLVGPGLWEEVFRVLEDGDVQGYQDAQRLRPRLGQRGVQEDDAATGSGNQDQMDVDEDSDITLMPQERSRKDGTGETRRTLSWIWLAPRTTGANDDEQDDLLRVEWAKSQARALRASEEVMRLKEEMRRVLESLKWKAEWWKQRPQRQDSIGKGLQEAQNSYAQTQSTIQSALANQFENLWRTPLEDEDRDSDNEVQASTASTVEVTIERDDDDEDEDDGKDDGLTGYDEDEEM